MIQNYLRYIFVFIVALLTQSVFSNAILIFGWKPDIILIFVVMFALQYGSTAGSTAGFFVGLASDLMSWQLLGIGALSKTIAGYLAPKIGKAVPKRNRFLISLFASGLIHDIIFNYINTLGKEIHWWALLLLHIVPNLLYTAIIGVVVYYSLDIWLAGDE